MRRVVVLGGSAAGLLTALLLARRGSEVVVLEGERAEVAVPSLASAVAQRAGAPQAVHAHGALARLRRELLDAAPDAREALVRSGVRELHLVEGMWPTIRDRGSRPGDQELVVFQFRRHAFDRVLFELAAMTARVELRYGQAAAGLELSAGRRVLGVRAEGGECLPADVVVDASGRRSPVPRWLRERGIELPLEAWDCGLVYFTRHYQVTSDRDLPKLNRIAFASGLLSTATVSWFPGDNNTATLAFAALAEDKLLKAVRDPHRFQAVAATIPEIAPWLEVSQPTTGVFAMGALKNTLRRTVVNGTQPVLGLYLVGDSCCTTNPTLGRGLSFLAAQARRLAEILDESPDDPAEAGLQMEAFIDSEIEPRFRENAERDRDLAAGFRAALAGEAATLAPPEPRPDRLAIAELIAAAQHDADLYRLSMRINHLLTDLSPLDDPEVISRARELQPEQPPPPTPTGPARAQLAELLNA